MRVGVIGMLIAAVVLTTQPTAAHQRDVVTPDRVGPIAMRESTVAEMKDLFGEPRSRAVKEVGCFKVVRLRWEQLQTFHYKQSRTIADVRVRDDSIQGTSGIYRFHTPRELRVGDSEELLRELYPHRQPLTHPGGGHTHYRLAGNYDKVLAKVVDGVVTELESAPFEYC